MAPAWSCPLIKLGKDTTIIRSHAPQSRSVYLCFIPGDPLAEPGSEAWKLGVLTGAKEGWRGGLPEGGLSKFAHPGSAAGAGAGCGAAGSATTEGTGSKPRRFSCRPML